METIIDLLKREISRAEYTPIDCTFGNLWKYKKGVDYWLIIGYLLDEDAQIKLFEKMQSFFGDYPDAVKNTSVLCVIKRDTIDIDSIIKIENNVNYFKKYVLKYTDATWNEIKDLVSKKTISELVMKEDIFESLTQGKNTLLYDIAHKLPQILLDVHSKDMAKIEEINPLSPKMTNMLEWIQDLDESNDDLLSIVKRKAKDYGNC